MVQEQVHMTNVVIDYRKHNVEVDNKDMEVTNQEFLLLSYLLERKNQAIQRRELLREVWSLPDTVVTRAPDDALKRLRRKLEKSRAELEIQTIRGYGFMVTEKGK